MIYILSGNIAQANYIAKNHSLQPRDWKFVSSGETLHGCGRGATLWLYGTWRERHDGGRLYDDAIAREMRVFRPIDRYEP